MNACHTKILLPRPANMLDGLHLGCQSNCALKTQSHWLLLTAARVPIVLLGTFRRPDKEMWSLHPLAETEGIGLSTRYDLTTTLVGSKERILSFASRTQEAGSSIPNSYVLELYTYE